MIVDDDGDEIGANKASSQIERNMKAMAMLVVVILVIAAYISQLYKLQIKNGDYYRGKSQRVSSHTDTIPAQRGEIFDRNATLPMVVNSDSFVVSLNPAEIPRGYYDTVTSRLSSILGIAKLEIDRKIPEKSRKIYKSIDIKMNVPFSVISNIAENIIDLPGVSWQLKPIRRYVETGSISHVVGYVGDITKEEINMMYNQGYTENMVVGKMGIEEQYDSLLQGTPGSVRKNVDARGRAISNELITTQPQMGKSLVLTIDSRIQELAEKALGNRVGAAVVLKPASGEILAMVSYPYYDQNIFSNDDAAAQYNKLVKSPNNPLLNRVVNAVYPPASTFKTIMTTAALSERAKELWLTGICLLDAQGELVCEYTENGIGYAQLRSGIKLESILSVIDYPQKTYVKHVELDDGSFADVAVHSCADGAGAVLAYRYTGAEFSQKSVLSIQPLIDSYGVNSTGTLLVVEENRVSASNDPTLIGMNIFESERLMSIRRSNRADKLVRVYAPKGIEQCYGMYSHGRNYSLYAYVPARQVYDLTVMNLVITLVMYILVLTFVQGFRWNSAKDFFMQQENSEQEYKKSLEQKNAALELAVQRETKANLAKREFLFNMSHDIRTPMNAIIGFTALAQTHIDERYPFPASIFCPLSTMCWI